MAWQTGTFRMSEPALKTARNSWPCSSELWPIISHLFCQSFVFPPVTGRALELLLYKTPVDDYRLKYMSVIFPTNGCRTQSKVSFHRAHNCSSNPDTSQILWPGHFYPVVYGFNGKQLQVSWQRYLTLTEPACCWPQSYASLQQEGHSCFISLSRSFKCAACETCWAIWGSGYLKVLSAGRIFYGFWKK